MITYWVCHTPGCHTVWTAEISEADAATLKACGIDPAKVRKAYCAQCRRAYAISQDAKKSPTRPAPPQQNMPGWAGPDSTKPAAKRAKWGATK